MIVSTRGFAAPSANYFHAILGKMKPATSFGDSFDPYRETAEKAGNYQWSHPMTHGRGMATAARAA